MKRKILLLLNFILLISNCDFKYDNPVDTDVALPTPKVLQLSQDNEWIRLAWKANDMYKSGYQIMRKQAEENWTIIANIDSFQRVAYLDTGIQSNKIYDYRICGKADENISAYSEINSIEAEFTAPYDIQHENLSEHSMHLGWKDSCDFEFGFKIYQNNGNSWIPVGNVQNNQTEFIVNGLNYNLQYSYYIIGYTDKNESLKSGIYSARVLLDHPSGLVFKPLNDHEIRLDWQDNSSFESGFIVERRAGITDPWKEIARVGENQINCVDSSVISNIEYAYRVKAYSDNHESEYSNQISAQTDFPAPVNLQINSVNSYSAMVTWIDNCTFETGFLVQFTVDGQTDTISISLPANTTQFTLDDIYKENIYVIQIQAQTEYNKSKPLTGKIRFGDNYSIRDVPALSGNRINSIDFSSDATMAAFGREGNVCGIWSAVSWSLLQSVAGNSNDQNANVVNTAFAHESPWLALGNATGSTRIINNDGWAELNNLYLNSYSLSVCRFSQDDNYLAAAQYKFIYLWDTGDWSYSKTLSDHTDQINDIDFSINGQWLATAGDDAQIVIYSTNDWKKLQTLTEHSDNITSICFSPNAQFLASGAADGEIWIWSTDSWTGTRLSDEVSGISGLTFSGNNNWLATSIDGSSQIKIWSTIDWQPVKTLTAKNNSITALQYSPDDQWLSAGYQNGDVSIWNVEGAWILE